MRVVILGEAPSRKSDPSRPFSGDSGRRLAKIAGVDHGELLAMFEPANLLSEWPGRSGGRKGDSLPKSAVRRAWRRSRMELLGRRVVLASRRMAESLGVRVDRIGFMVWVSGALDGPAEIAVIPHPSGIVRFWNNPVNVEAARRFLAEAAECAG